MYRIIIFYRKKSRRTSVTWKLECKLEKKRVPNLVVYLQNHKLTLLFGKGKKTAAEKSSFVLAL